MRKFPRTLCLALILLTGPFPARAVSGGDFLRIVSAPERNLFVQERQFQVLCEYVCSHLPVPMKVEVLESYRAVLNALSAGEAHGGFLGSFSGAYGIEKFGLVPLVRPQWLSGETHFRSYVFTRSGLSLTRDVGTWKGAPIVFVSPLTTSGYFFPLALLRRAGITEPGTFFSRVQFSGSHDAAIWMVANGMADLGAVKGTIFEESLLNRPDMKKKLKVLYKGGQFPDSTLMVAPGVPREVREALRTVFLRMADNPEGVASLRKFGARKFVRATREDYASVRSVVKECGYDLADLEIPKR